MLAQKFVSVIQPIRWPLLVGVGTNLCLWLVFSQLAWAQFFGPPLLRPVGGVQFNPHGVLNDQSTNLPQDVVDSLQRGLKALDSDISQPGLRLISLNGLEHKIQQCQQEGRPLPAELLYMAGLQRIEYVIVSPDSNDLIVAGPGEGLTTNREGQVVGNVSGMPPIHLEDFLVAIRHSDEARSGFGISVSIDPTEEGARRAQQAIQNFHARSFDSHAARLVEEAGGEQIISLTGIPADSRFAQVLVSADYKMKRLAMGLDPAPEFLPSILAMAQAKGSAVRNMNPRFWMETNYQPVSVDKDKSVWKLNGQAVRTKTEEEAKSTGKLKPNKLAQKWAHEMTSHFERLCLIEPVFRELRNVMDLSVVAAIVAHEKLLNRTNLKLPSIIGSEKIATPSWNVPKSIPTQCSFANVGNSLLVTTSGGVTVDSWSVAVNTSIDSKLNGFGVGVLDKNSDRWWWNAR